MTEPFQPIPGAPPTPTILVVDDDRRVLELLEVALTASGYRVLTAADPIAEAWIAADEIDRDPTADLLAAGLPDEATMTIVGWPGITAAGLRRRGDVEVASGVVIVVEVRPEDRGIRTGRYYPINPQRGTQALAYGE